jgi:hypothetical protein
MYTEYLGEGYHEKIRKMLTMNEELLPDRIIDADANIGAMKSLIAPVLNKYNVQKKIDSKETFGQLSEAALYYLCGILCMAMKSRTSAPPYNLPKYRKNWDKKQKNYMQKGNLHLQGLMSYVNKIQ